MRVVASSCSIRKRSCNSRAETWPGAVGSATVVGNLTLHGTTREISIPVHLSLSPENEFTGDGEVTFRYTDFGVAVPKLAYIFPAGDEVTVKFRIIAKNPQPAASPSASAP